MARDIDQSPEDASLRPEASRPTHSEDGVDLTLIRWMLSMTPEERLLTLQRTVRAILRLRDAGSKPFTLKEEMGREKDLAMLAVLRRTLQERDRR